MKTSRVLLGLAVLCAAALPASADLTAVLGNGHGSMFGGAIHGIGGYYQATLSGTFTGTGFTIPMSFRTFCVESKYFHPNTTYTATIADEVLDFGPKTVVAATKNLYALYVDGDATLGWSVVGNNGSKNRVMQALLWDYQQVFGGASVAYNLLNSTEKALYAEWNTYNSTHASANAANVKVMNLWGTNGADIQSQLIMTTPLGSIVPAPGAALLAVIGLGFVNTIKRRLA